jgi:hypothetical protein
VSLPSGDGAWAGSHRTGPGHERLFKHREDVRVAQQGFDDEPAGSDISRQPEQADVDAALP